MGFPLGPLLLGGGGPLAILVQVPDFHGSVSGAGGDAATIVIECDIVDVVLVRRLEDLWHCFFGLDSLN
jgi:hypothetical protein